MLSFKCENKVLQFQLAITVRALKYFCPFTYTFLDRHSGICENRS